MTVLFMFSGSASIIFISTVESTMALVLLLFTYGASVIPLSYLYSLLFQSYSTAQISIMSIHFVTGFVTVIAYFVMTTIPETQELAESLVLFFRLFPPYLIGEGLINISVNNFLNSYHSYRKTNYLRWTVTGRNICYMIIEGIVFFSIILIIESPTVRLLWREVKERVKQIINYYNIDFFNYESLNNNNNNNNTVDDDVFMEEEVVNNNSNPSEYSLLIKNLTKKYSDNICGIGKTKIAVNNISFGCKQGER